MESLSLRVDRVTVMYGNYRALHEVNLDFEPGQYCVLIGENGAGKSTLLRCSAAWQRPSSGTVSVFGSPVEENERAVRAWIKLVPDTPQFYAELTVWEHIAWVAQAHRVTGWQSMANDWMQAFGIASNRDAYPASFSRGMQYKLAVIMSLISQPKLLFLDEPFGPLDPYSQAYLARQLRAKADEGVTIMASTHVLPDSDPPDRIIVLDQGELVRDALWERVQAQYPGVAQSAIPIQVLRDVLQIRRRPS